MKTKLEKLRQHINDPEHHDWAIEYIVRALFDAVNKSIIVQHAHKHTQLKKAKEAQEWIRNPHTRFPSLKQACEMVGGSLSPLTVQRWLDALLEEQGDPLMGEDVDLDLDEQVDWIVEAVCDFFGVHPLMVVDTQRGSPEKGTPEQEAFKWICYLSYVMTTMTQAETAEALKSSKSTIRRYKYVVDEEDEETKKKMEKFALNYKG